MKIEPPQIVAAALDLLDEVGLDALTTRKLAERLGVRQPSLYWHFKTRQALLDAMSAEVLVRGHHYHTPRPGDDWQSFLMKSGQSLRRALLAHRDGARLHAAATATPADPPRLEAQLRFLTSQGLSLETALYLGLAIIRYTVGCALEDQAAAAPEDGSADYPLAAEAAAIRRDGGREAAYLHGLRLLIDGADF